MEKLELKKIEFKAMIVAELTECFNELILLKSSLIELEQKIVSDFEKKVDNGVFEERNKMLIFSELTELNYVFKLGNVCSRKELKALMNFTEKKKISFKLNSMKKGISCCLELGDIDELTSTSKDQ